MSMYVRYTQPKGLKAQFEIIHYGEGQIHMKCPICGQELRPGKKIRIICCAIIAKEVQNSTKCSQSTEESRKAGA